WVWRGGWVWVKGHHIRGVVAAMPAEIVEVIPARPSPAHYWVKGYHAWEGGRWAWHRGVWVRWHAPPQNVRPRPPQGCRGSCEPRGGCPLPGRPLSGQRGRLSGLIFGTYFT